MVLSLLCSIWHSDTSGTVALLGLLSIYMSSAELLLLFTVITPSSIIFDISRPGGRPQRGTAGALLFSWC
jgi:hypothetical protein